MAELEIKMPDLSTTGDTIVLLKWLVAVGDNIKLGQPIAEIETDKATMELEAGVSGKLTKIVVAAGESAKVGSAVAMIESDRVESPVKKTEVAAAPAIAQQSSTNVVSAPVEKKSGGMFAKNKAKMSGGSADAIAMSPTQKVVSQRLTESKQTVPHYYLTSSVNAEGMASFRAASKPEKIVWDAFFVSAVARAVAKFEKFTYRLKGDKFEKSGLDAVGIAVDLDDELFVITVEDASKKNVKQISADIVDKVAKLKSGDLSARKLKPANITITNLGSANVKHFSAIVNPPESAILAIGKIASVPVVKNGQLAISDMADITLSVDHRIVNGKYAANFLSEVIVNIESNWK